MSNDMPIFRIHRFLSVSLFNQILKTNFLLNKFSGNIGGLCGVVGGYSLIGFTEMIYFVIKQTVLFFMRKFHIKIRSSDVIIYP